MDFGTAIKTCFGKYVEFQGRAARSEYWFFALFNILVYSALFIVGMIVGGIVGGKAAAGAGLMAGMGVSLVLVGVYGLATLLPTIAVTIRRFHDAGFSGWYLLAFFLCGFVPLLNFASSIASFVFTVMPSKDENQWGPRPA